MDQNTNSLAKAISPVIEGLESRKLLSIALIDGQLQIKATQDNDIVTVDSNDFASRIRVQVNLIIRRFNTLDVNSITSAGLTATTTSSSPPMWTCPAPAFTATPALTP